MSATNRGSKRAESDYYPTPAWAVDRFMEAWPHELFDCPVMFEPAVGDGAIIRAVNAHLDSVGRAPPTWHSCDVREECADQVAGLSDHHQTGDFVAMGGALIDAPRADIIITNPPFKESLEFARRCMALNPIMLSLLLRLNWLGSETRHEFVTTTQPSVYVLPNRADFSGGGGDSIEYAWFTWFPRGFLPTRWDFDGKVIGVRECRELVGRCKVLELTSGDVRAAQRPRMVEL